MPIGKYVTNLGVIGAAAGALGTAKRTQAMPNDWRRLLVWVVWAAGLALAIASVSMQDDDVRSETEADAEARDAKQAAKAAKQERKAALKRA